MHQKVFFTVTDSALGILLMGGTSLGICSVKLGNDQQELLDEFYLEFKRSELIPDENYLRKWLIPLQEYLAGKSNWPILPYDICGSEFQHKVWKWLWTIPSGQTYYYSDATKAMGAPKSTRAFANACAKNPVALVIPCHRILPKVGGIGGFRWDPKRKKILLQLEENDIV